MVEQFPKTKNWAFKIYKHWDAFMLLQQMLDVFMESMFEADVLLPGQVTSQLNFFGNIYR